jgi:hypothetical protein
MPLTPDALSNGFAPLPSAVPKDESPWMWTPTSGFLSLAVGSPLPDEDDDGALVLHLLVDPVDDGLLAAALHLFPVLGVEEGLALQRFDVAHELDSAYVAVVVERVEHRLGRHRWLLTVNGRAVLDPDLRLRSTTDN